MACRRWIITLTNTVKMASVQHVGMNATFRVTAYVPLVNWYRTREVNYQEELWYVSISILLL